MRTLRIGILIVSKKEHQTQKQRNIMQGLIEQLKNET